MRSARTRCRRSFWSTCCPHRHLRVREHEKRWLIRGDRQLPQEQPEVFLNSRRGAIEEIARLPADNEEKAILEEIFNLPEKFKIVTHLYYVEGYKCAEIVRFWAWRSPPSKCGWKRDGNCWKIQWEKGEVFAWMRADQRCVWNHAYHEGDGSENPCGSWVSGQETQKGRLRRRSRGFIIDWLWQQPSCWHCLLYFRYCRWRRPLEDLYERISCAGEEVKAEGKFLELDEDASNEMEKFTVASGRRENWY